MSSASTTSDSASASTDPTTSSAAQTSSDAATSAAQPTATSTAVTTSIITPSTSSVVLVTSVVTQSPTPAATSPSQVITFITSTQTPTITPTQLPSTLSNTATSSGAPPLTTTSAEQSKSSGLSSGGTIAVAVVVPLVAIVLIVCGLLFFWKKRKERKAAEEQRKKEIEEYGLNPNHDPTLRPPGQTYSGTQSEMTEDHSGYRGWGAAGASQRKTSTLLSGGMGAASKTVSDSSSNPGGYAYPAAANGPAELHSGDNPPQDGLQGAAGAGAMAMGRGEGRQNIQRGPSNASSAYSTGPAQSQTSDDVAGGAPGPYYHEEGPYYHDVAPQPGPYDDGPYGGDQPVVRDLQARRNARIERPPPFSQQPNSGIAQNF